MFSPSEAPVSPGVGSLTTSETDESSYTYGYSNESAGEYDSASFEANALYDATILAHGTQGWSAPEANRDAESRVPALDVYSFGVTVLEVSPNSSYHLLNKPA